MISAEHIQELHLKGETLVRGEISLSDLHAIAVKLGLGDHEEICISPGAGETLKIHVPSK